MNAPVPASERIQSLLAMAGLESSGDVSLLGDGYEQWAFRAGDLVVRLPKDPERVEIAEKLRREVKLSRVIAGRLPAPVPELTLHELADGTLFSIHRLIEGVPLWQLKRPLAPGFGAAMGRFLRAQHTLPVDELSVVGLEVVDGDALRQRHIEAYEDIVRRVFPLISCEGRSHVAAVMESLINDRRSYDYQPALVHADLDHRNVLADPETGELAGVIDFGDAEIANPLSDYGEVDMAILRRFEAEGQLDDLLDGSGISREDVERRRGFSEVWWPLSDIRFGLDRREDDLVEAGIQALNEVVPFRTRC
ncbi:MAG: phosphotransferase family protein [Dehalococcoidia bacterium]